MQAKTNGQENSNFSNGDRKFKCIEYFMLKPQRNMGESRNPLSKQKTKYDGFFKPNNIVDVFLRIDRRLLNKKMGVNVCFVGSNISRNRRSMIKRHEADRADKRNGT